jgi:hypothetical protein
MDVDEVAHAGRKVFRGPSLGHLHLAPGAMRVEEDEQVCAAIAPITRNRSARSVPTSRSFASKASRPQVGASIPAFLPQASNIASTFASAWITIYDLATAERQEASLRGQASVCGLHYVGV